MNESLPSGMRSVAAALVARLDERQRAAACHDFSADAARRWIEYRPQARPGLSLAELSGAARKGAHRLLATALSPHAHAQAMTIIALEEVLDRAEGWTRGRHSNDYWVAVFGDPERDERWGWRFEGHHLSVSMTVVGDEVYPSPVFLGANPATVSYDGHPVVRPLALEEELARGLLDAMGPVGRALAVTAARPRDDIASAQDPVVLGPIEPMGIAASSLEPAARAVLDQLVAVYLDRLVPELAEQEARRVDPATLHFAWEGPTRPGAGHYYRIQAADLLIEYDNTQNDANHVHSVLRRPTRDFGGADPLATHLARWHGPDRRGDPT
jgi:hypothetical protein